MAPEGWLGKLGDGPLADSILYRIRNSSYTIIQNCYEVTFVKTKLHSYFKNIQF